MIIRLIRRRAIKEQLEKFTGKKIRYIKRGEYMGGGKYGPTYELASTYRYDTVINHTLIFSPKRSQPLDVGCVRYKNSEALRKYFADKRFVNTTPDTLKYDIITHTSTLWAAYADTFDKWLFAKQLLRAAIKFFDK